MAGANVRPLCRLHDFLDLGKVASDWMPLASIDERRLLLRADGLRLPAAGTEPAPGRRCNRARHGPLQHNPLPLTLLVGIRHRYGRQECLGVGMGGTVIDVVAGTNLD